MAKLKFSRLVNPSFGPALQAINDAALPWAVAYKLKKLTNAVEVETKAFGDLRKEIYERHAKKGEDGKPIVGPGNSYSFDTNAAGFCEALEKDYAELLALEVELPSILIEELTGKAGTVEFKASTLVALDTLIEYPTEPPPPAP